LLHELRRISGKRDVTVDGDTKDVGVGEKGEKPGEHSRWPLLNKGSKRVTRQSVESVSKTKEDTKGNRRVDNEKRNGGKKRKG